MAGLIAALDCAASAQVTFLGTQIGVANGTWSAPSAVAVDGQGNLFIADNNCVVELSPSGNGFGAPVIVLSGLSSPSGIAADWNGNIFVSDTGNNRILMLPFTGTGLGAAVTLASGLNAPMGLAVDSADNLFVADSGNNRIVELPFAAGMYGAPVVAGSGLSNPMGVAVDPGRNLWIADTGNRRIVKEPYTAGGYSTQQLNWVGWMTPVSIAVDKSYNVYISDSDTETISKAPWDAGIGRFDNMVGVGSGLSEITGIAVDGSNNVYISDAGRDQIFMVTPQSVAFGAADIGTSGSILTYNFGIAAGTTLGGIGIFSDGLSGRDYTDAGRSTCLLQTYPSASPCGVNVKFTPLTSGTRAGAIEFFDGNGNPLATAFISGTGNASQAAVIPGSATVLGEQLSGPSGVAVDGAGNVYIADTGNNRVVELAWTGSGYAPQTTLAVSGLVAPMGMAVDAAGNLFIASNGNNKLIKLPRTENGFGPQTNIGGDPNDPTGLAADANGDVFLTSPLSGGVVKLVWTGSGYVSQVNVGNYHKAPMGIAVDGTGNVFFSDPYQNNISEAQWTGTGYLSEVTVSASGVSFPSALAADQNRNLYILDSSRNRLTMLPWTGSGFGPEVVVATGFNAPSGMAIAGNAELFVADTGNNQVVKIDLSMPGALSFENAYLGSTSPDSAQVALVENVGNQPLTMSSVSYPPDFPEASAANACAENLQLGMGQSCELPVDFTPAVADATLTEAVTVTDDSLGVAGTQQAVSVTGTSLGKLAQTISFPAITGVVYGSAPVPLAATASSGLPVTYTVVSGPGTLGGQTVRITGAGAIVVEATQAGSNAYSPAPAVEISIQVAPAILTVTVPSVTAYYGAVPASFYYTIAGLVNGDGAGAVYSGKPSITTTANNKSNAGTYALIASQGTLSSTNYAFAFVTGTLTVTKAWIKITAASFSRVYGTPMTALTWSMSGFLNGDTASVVTGAPAVTSLANSGSPVGTYPIQVSSGTLEATNYQFEGVNGTITVTPALLTVTGANQSITYGGMIPVLGYWFSGFRNGDTSDCVSGSPAISTSATAQSGAGSYPTLPSQGTLSAMNYTFKFVAGVLSIGKAPLLVQPANASMVYGSALPPLSYVLSGLVNGDTAAAAVTGAPRLSTSATSASKPGSYAVTAAIGTLAAKNYTFVFGSGTLTVTQAVLTVTPSAVSMTYGADVPAFSYQLSGFVNGDNAGVVHGAPVLTSSVTKTSSAGVYPIVIAAGSLSAANYSFRLVNGEITVGKALLTVTPANQSMTYGAALPAMTYVLSGFVNGDSQQAATVGEPAIITTAKSNSSAGVYPVTAALGSLDAKNYSFRFASGTLTVNKAPLTVTASNLSMSFGASVPPLAFAMSGWVNGDTQASAITGEPFLFAGVTPKTGPGSYPITIASGTMKASNYQLIFRSGTLTIKPSGGPYVKPAPAR